MKKSLIILMTLAAAGCSTFKLADTRVACTVAKDEAVTVMDFGALRIGGKVDDRDRAVICK